MHMILNLYMYMCIYHMYMYVRTLYVRVLKDSLQNFISYLHFLYIKQQNRFTRPLDIYSHCKVMSPYKS